MVDFERLLAVRDLTLYPIHSESTEGDRVSLLMMQGCVRRYFGHYNYLEIGSHLGGMLIPHLRDPLCTSVVSIDKRPQSMPDVRGSDLAYEQNNTRRMIDGLRAELTDSELAKLSTFDTDVREVSARAIASKPDLVMIDGEHTTQATISDFLNLLRVAHDETIFMFHDSNIVFDAILAIEAFLQFQGHRIATMFLDDNVGVILRGHSVNLQSSLSERKRKRSTFLAQARQYLESQIAHHFETSKPLSATATDEQLPVETL